MARALFNPSTPLMRLHPACTTEASSERRDAATQHFNPQPTSGTQRRERGKLVGRRLTDDGDGKRVDLGEHQFGGGSESPTSNSGLHGG